MEFSLSVGRHQQRLARDSEMIQNCVTVSFLAWDVIDCAGDDNPQRLGHAASTLFDEVMQKAWHVSEGKANAQNIRNVFCCGGAVYGDACCRGQKR
jgi:hypothetical protein